MRNKSTNIVVVSVYERLHARHLPTTQDSIIISLFLRLKSLEKNA
jgi:hypothetical protein